MAAKAKKKAKKKAAAKRGKKETLYFRAPDLSMYKMSASWVPAEGGGLDLSEMPDGECWSWDGKAWSKCDGLPEGARHTKNLAGVGM